MLRPRVSAFALLLFLAGGDDHVSAGAHAGHVGASCSDHEEFGALQMQTKSRTVQERREQSAGIFRDTYYTFLSDLDVLSQALDPFTSQQQLQLLNRSVATIVDLVTIINIKAVDVTGNATAAVTSLVELIGTSVGVISAGSDLFLPSETAEKVAGWTKDIQTTLDQLVLNVRKIPEQVEAVQTEFMERGNAILAKIQSLYPSAPSIPLGATSQALIERMTRGFWDWIKNLFNRITGRSRGKTEDVGDKLDTVINDFNTTLPGILLFINTSTTELMGDFSATIDAAIATINVLVPGPVAQRIETTVKPFVQRLHGTLQMAVEQLMTTFSEVQGRLDSLAHFVMSVRTITYSG